MANRSHDDGDSVSESSDPLDMRGEDGWEDVEDDTVEESFTCLFDSKVFDTVNGMFQYCKDKYDFDIWDLQQSQDLDFLGLVKLVNYVRGQVKTGNIHPDVTSKQNFDDEINLMPVMEDDAVLYNLEEIIQASKQTSNDVEDLREQLDSLTSQFSAYRNDVQKLMKLDLDDQPESSTSTKQGPGRARTQIDDDYFTGYSYNAIHESMLKDRVRTDAYRDFIYDNKDIFHDKVVLDVGCGTGILSMFCAKAGAKQVIAVDNSKIIEKAEQNIKANKLENKIICIQGKIEDIPLPVKKVDIIVSEWMGYCLLFESMLDSVIYARDKYLAPDGLMVPSHIDIRMAPLADSELRTSYIDFWRDVYGFDMTAMLERAHEEALIRSIDGKECCSESQLVRRLDLHTVGVVDLDFTEPFQMSILDGFDVLEGFVLWFDTFFMRSRSIDVDTIAQAKQKGGVAFSTGPAPEILTHWEQTVCLLKEPRAGLKAGQILKGEVKFMKGKDSHRSLDLDFKWEIEGQKGLQTWFLT